MNLMMETTSRWLIDCNAVFMEHKEFPFFVEDGCNNIRNLIDLIERNNIDPLTRSWFILYNQWTNVSECATNIRALTHVGSWKSLNLRMCNLNIFRTIATSKTNIIKLGGRKCHSKVYIFQTTLIQSVESSKRHFFLFCGLFVGYFVCISCEVLD